MYRFINENARARRVDYTQLPSIPSTFLPPTIPLPSLHSSLLSPFLFLPSIPLSSLPSFSPLPSMLAPSLRPFLPPSLPPSLCSLFIYLSLSSMFFTHSARKFWPTQVAAVLPNCSINSPVSSRKLAAFTTTSHPHQVRTYTLIQVRFVLLPLADSHPFSSASRSVSPYY